MKYIIFIFLFCCPGKIHAQINTQYLLNTWTKVHNEMEDGSRDIHGFSSEFYQWEITDSSLAIKEEPLQNFRFFPAFRLMNQNIIITPYLSFEIEKLTSDSLVVIERLSQISDKDKIRKIWFLTNRMYHQKMKESHKNDSIFITSKSYSPIFDVNFLRFFNKSFFKAHPKAEFEVFGNFILYPKKQKVEFEVIKNENKYEDQKALEFLHSKIEQSFSFWDLTYFQEYHKILVPGLFIINSPSTTIGLVMIDTSKINLEDRKRKEDLVTKSKGYFKKGLSEFKKKKYQKAIVLFQKSYELDPKNMDALYNLAAIYSLTGNQESICETLKILKDLGQTDGIILYEKNCQNF